MPESRRMLKDANERTRIKKKRVSSFNNKNVQGRVFHAIGTALSSLLQNFHRLLFPLIEPFICLPREKLASSAVGVKGGSTRTNESSLPSSAGRGMASPPPGEE
jgi:hypothetical protein